MRKSHREPPSVPFNVNRHALPHLLKNERSYIVNIASLSAGWNKYPWLAAYAASKAGVLALTKSLAAEYIKKGLRANCLCPGGMDTGSTQDARAFLTRGGFDQELLSFVLPKIAWPPTSPRNVALVIAFLASDEAQNINGTALIADEGIYAG